MESWTELLKIARIVGTPIIALETVDPRETARMVSRDSTDPAAWWDCAAGPRALNDAGRGAVADVWPDPYQAMNLPEMLGSASKLPAGSMLFISMAHRFLESESVIQAVSNLREPFKGSGSTLILLVVPGAKLPAELGQDVLTVERPLPSPAEIRPIVEGICKAASEQLGKAMPSDAELDAASGALVGLSEFAAESAVALAVNDGGISPSSLWERKRTMINSTAGLQLVPPGAETFDGIGGLKAIREFGKRLFTGADAPRIVVWIDELEKALAGTGTATGSGDTSGTSQDQLGTLLRYQEENRWDGILLVGPPGSGKSMIAKSLGSTFGVPTIMLDLGAMKGSLVGQSEARIRAAMRIIQALAGKSALFVATCNKLDSVPPELRRRYTLGIWYSDLPTMEERRAIWEIHLSKNGLKGDLRALLSLPWTGAEIRNACALAKRLGISPLDASKYIVPVSKSDPEGIERLRRAADGRFLSVSTEGAFKAEGAADSTVRKMGK